MKILFAILTYENYFCERYQKITMIRGRKILTNIFNPSFDTRDKRRGNKGIYTQERDVCLAYRYYFHYEVKRSRFEDTILYLEKEFFISETTIIHKLTTNNDLLKDISRERPSITSLKKRYHHFNWN